MQDQARSTALESRKGIGSTGHLIEEEKVILVTILLRSTSITEAEIDVGFELQESEACDKDVMKYREAGWSGSGDLVKLFGVCMMSIGMLRLLGKTI